MGGKALPEGLSGSCLAIGEAATIDALERIIHEGLACLQTAFVHSTMRFKRTNQHTNGAL